MNDWKKLLRAPSPWSVLAFVLPLWACRLLFAQGIDMRDDGWWLLGAQHAAGIHDSLHLEEASGRFLLLRAFQLLLGTDAATLVWLQALATATGATLSYLLVRDSGRRIAAWLAVFTAVALGPLPLWLLPPMLLALGLQRGNLRLAGAGIALSFPLGAGSVAMAALVALCAWRPVEEQRPWRFALWGGAAGAGLFLLVALLSGGLAAEFRAGWIHPAERAFHGLGDGSAWSWWKSMRAGPLLSRPFAELHTDEGLDPLFAAHPMLRAWSFRALYCLVWLGVAGAATQLYRRRRGDLGAALALSAAVCLLVRGDLIQLRAALLLGIPGFLLLWGARWVPMLLALPLLMPMAEKSWLLTHHYRETLVLWDAPRAGILLDRESVREIETLNEQIPGRGEALLAWPNAAGLHWFLERPPASRHVRQPLSDPSDAMIEEFLEHKTAAVLLGPECLRGARALSVLQPGLHEYLRTQYQVLGSAEMFGQSFRLLSLAPEGLELDDLPLPQLMPAAEMGIGTDAAPVLRKGLAIGQSFRMGGTDFRGFSLRWRSSRDGVVLPLRFHLWKKDGERYETLLHYFDADVEIDRSGIRSYLRIGPLPDTANQELALSFNLREEIDFDVQPLWHRHDEGENPTDFYLLGTAMINDEPVPADLYFAIY